jgi:hypothetical protein
MADTVTIERDHWKEFLDELTDERVGYQVSMEVLDRSYGDPHEVEKMPFSYVNYDPKDDVVVLGVGGNSPRFPVLLRHMIWHPSDLEITEAKVIEADLRVAEKDGTTTLVHFFPAPALPPPRY